MGFDRFSVVSLHQGNVGGGSGSCGGGKSKIEQLDRSGCFVWECKHRPGYIEDDFHDGSHFLAVEFQRVVPGSGECLPVDVARIISGEVVAMVLKVEGASHAQSRVVARISPPVSILQRESKEVRIAPRLRGDGFAFHR